MRLTNGEATIRGNGRWAKVTKTATGFVVAFGFEGSVKAERSQSFNGPDRRARDWADVVSSSWVEDGLADER